MLLRAFRYSLLAVLALYVLRNPEEAAHTANAIGAAFMFTADALGTFANAL